MTAAAPSFARWALRWLAMLAFVACTVLASLWFLGGDALHSTALATSANATAAATPEQMERGSYLARVGNCAHCHTARGGLPYAGGRAIETPFGQVISTNITPDRMAGLGTWNADDFWRALHHGMAKDGRALYPAFPYTSFTRISRADSDALFAYLQSVPQASTLRQPHALRWPYNTELALRVWRALYFQPAAPVQTAPTDTAARGAYLVDGLGHCMECHAARNALGAMASSGKGGAVLPGSQWYAPALNDAAQGSVAAWSEADTVRFLQTGSNAHANASGPMAAVVLHGTQYLTDADAQAMAAHLRALPLVGAPAPGQTTSTAVAATQAEAAALAATGATPTTAPGAATPKGGQLYADHCAACHGQQGQGQAGAYPALAGNRAVLLTPTNNLVLTVLGGGFGPSTHGNPQPFGMPAYMLQLSDADIADVLTYVRSAWGNQAAAVSALDINTPRRARVH